MANIKHSSPYDVIIVGAGIAGSTLAAALASGSHGLRIALVEARPSPAHALPEKGFSVHDFEPRVSALTHASCSTMQRLGVWPGVPPDRCCRFKSMRVWDARGSGQIDFNCKDIGAEKLGCVVENNVLAAALREHLQTQGSVYLRDGSAVATAHCDSNGANVQLEDGGSLTSTLMVAADGANSPLRETMNMPVRRWDYHQDAIVCTAKNTRPHQDTAWQIFTEQGPLAFLPLPPATDNSADAGRLCSIVWSQSRARAEQLMALDDNEFANALGVAFEHKLGDVEAVSRRFSFPLAQQHAKDYVQSSFALIADAAHSLHPLAGQGLNLGIADAMSLSGKLFEAIEAGRPINDIKYLKRYQRERKTDNLAMLAAVESFYHLYQRDLPLTLRWLRNEGMRTVANTAWLKRLILRHAMGAQDSANNSEKGYA
ncbi:MAG: UbiH/UbiF/VisC/COQ6 family ubiquinone biosynthesis hydroxylase [Pseudomonadales bacterium]|nr:UbiH/UbiF/VisC/COQ6 family ubiquinone biosynthesis hydroxylase [Pseudomonadales bacterium]